MSNIVLETLKSKLKETINKKDKLEFRLHRNNLGEICALRQKFKELLETDREEAYKFATENVGKEKELFKEAEYINKNHIKLLDQICSYNNQISDLSQEISLQEMRR